MDNEQGKLIIKKIKVYGIVQGVGFRPLVYRIAKKLKINGTVRNVGGYVEIIAQSTSERITALLKELEAGNCGGCEIVRIDTEDASGMGYNDFVILGSKESEEVSILPPDLPVCPDCRKELYQEKDRRYGNPFISCMSCGPRYTIIEELPYDRHTTTMRDFDMCDHCHEEYVSNTDRRFHAQTISCNDCGPYLIYRDKSGIKSITDDKPYVPAKMKAIRENLTDSGTGTLIEQAAFEKAVSVLKGGGILAVKGIGGYHLVCSPFLEDTVVRLRSLKGREEKPFAVMFHDLEQIREFCMISEEEAALLETKARPIVLLYMETNRMAPSTNKGSIYCGAFLPYTPLQLMLTGVCGPLIMTSANLSGKPVIREDHMIFSLDSEELDGILYNRRRIVRSVDDSVAKVIDAKPQMIRRSRGYVPYPVFLEQNSSSGQDQTPDATVSEGEEHKPTPTVFAAGGDLKAAFCLYKNGNAVVSQYFGDLEEATVMEEYQNSYQDLKRLLKIEPEAAVCDLHPNYFSSQFAKNMGIPLLQVQHHHAHVASVMAEHDLKGKVIGVAFDGTGYGTDGNIWGGEFLICEGADYIRAARLKYTKVLGGDDSMRDAKKTATCFLLEHGLDDYVTDNRVGIIKPAMEHRINTVLTSSMGRLFDAVSSILEIGHRNNYEGECAAFLEREAVLAERSHIEPVKLSFAISTEHEIIEIDPKPLLEQLCRLRSTEDKGSLALGFHYALAEAVKEVCLMLKAKFSTETVALSGGVFQNSVLTSRTARLLKDNGFPVFVNLAVPPNDGGISLGQTYISLHRDKSSDRSE